MKKVFMLFAMFLAIGVSAQEVKDEVATWDPYVSVGYSIGTTESDYYKDNTYVSAEFGLQKKNLALGVAVGRGSVSGLGAKHDQIGDYFASLNATVYQPVGVVDLFVTGGVGSYFRSDSAFIEYGFGGSYSFTDNFSGALKINNWGGTWYATPMLTFSL